MKRFAIILSSVVVAFAFIAMTTSNVQAQNSDQTDINLSLTVDEYIEAVPTIDWDLGETYRSGNSERMYTSNGWDIAYANCPFNVTVEGDNPAGDGRPIFAREEQGANSNGFDRLRSLYAIDVVTNGVSQDVTDWFDHSGKFPVSKDVTEAPHNGQVHMNMTLDVNGGTSHGTVPIRKTLIDPSFSWEESADAGEYEASLKVTFTAL